MTTFTVQSILSRRTTSSAVISWAPLLSAHQCPQQVVVAAHDRSDSVEQTAAQSNKPIRSQFCIKRRCQYRRPDQVLSPAVLPLSCDEGIPGSPRDMRGISWGRLCLPCTAHQQKELDPDPILSRNERPLFFRKQSCAFSNV